MADPWTTETASAVRILCMAHDRTCAGTGFTASKYPRTRRGFFDMLEATLTLGENSPENHHLAVVAQRMLVKYNQKLPEISGTRVQEPHSDTPTSAPEPGGKAASRDDLRDASGALLNAFFDCLPPERLKKNDRHVLAQILLDIEGSVDFSQTHVPSDVDKLMEAQKAGARVIRSILGVDFVAPPTFEHLARELVELVPGRDGRHVPLAHLDRHFELMVQLDTLLEDARKLMGAHSKLFSEIVRELAVRHAGSIAEIENTLAAAWAALVGVPSRVTGAYTFSLALGNALLATELAQGDPPISSMLVRVADWTAAGPHGFTNASQMQALDLLYDTRTKRIALAQNTKSPQRALAQILIDDGLTSTVAVDRARAVFAEKPPHELFRWLSTRSYISRSARTMFVGDITALFLWNLGVGRDAMHHELLFAEALAHPEGQLMSARARAPSVTDASSDALLIRGRQIVAYSTLVYWAEIVIAALPHTVSQLRPAMRVSVDPAILSRGPREFAIASAHIILGATAGVVRIMQCKDYAVRPVALALANVDLGALLLRHFSSYDDRFAHRALALYALAR